MIKQKWLDRKGGEDYNSYSEFIINSEALSNEEKIFYLRRNDTKERSIKEYRSMIYKASIGKRVLRVQEEVDFKNNAIILNGKAERELSKIKDNSVDLILSDPPYGVEFKQNFYDDSANYVFTQIDIWFKEWIRVLKENSHVFLFVPTKEIHQWINSGIKAGFNFKNIITTEAHFIGRSFRPKNGFEFKAQPVLHFTKGTGKDFNNYDLIPTSASWLKDKRNTNPKPFTYIYPNIIGKDIIFANTKSTAKNSKGTERHPNEKNKEFLKFFIGIATNEGDVVLDSFAGSGSTLYAGLELGRKVIGVEQDQNWFSHINQKINNETHQ